MTQASTSKPTDTTGASDSTSASASTTAVIPKATSSATRRGPHRWLLLAAAVQAGLAALTFAGGDTRAMAPEVAVLPGLDPATLTNVTITSREKLDKPLQLARVQGQWQLPDYYQFPLEATEIDTALTNLARATSRGPMAKGPAAHAEFGVSDDKWDTKLVLRGPSGEKTIYLGKMAGRGAALRQAGSDNVFSAKGVMPHTWSPELSTWHKKPYIDASTPGAARVAYSVDGRSYEFKKNGDNWDIFIDGKLVVYPKGFEQAKYGVTRVISQASRVDIKTPGDPKLAANILMTVTVEPAAPAVPAADPAAPDAITPAPPTPIVYDIAKVDDGYWIKQQGAETAVIVSESQVDALVKPDVDSWGKKSLTDAEKAKQKPIDGLPGNLPTDFKAPTTLPWEE